MLHWSLCLFYSISPDMPENEATFAISAGGVTDAKEWAESLHCYLHQLVIKKYLNPFIYGVSENVPFEVFQKY